MTTQSKPASTPAAFKAKIARIHGNINARMRKGAIRGSINDAAASSTRKTILTRPRAPE